MGTYGRSLRYFRQDASLITGLLCLIGLQTALGLLAAWPMAILIDSVLTAAPQTSGFHAVALAILPTSRVGQVIGLALAGLVIKFSQDLLNVARTLLTARINYNGLMRVRCDLYRKLQSLALSYHKAQPQGDTLYRLTNDSSACQAILQTLITTAVAVIMLIAITCILMARSVPLTLLALGIAPFLAAANVYYGRRLKRESLACKNRDVEFTTTVQRSMSLITLVQAFGRETEEFTRFRGSIRNCIRAWFKLHGQEVAYWLIVGTILGAGGAAVFGYGGYLVWRDQFSTPTPRPGGMTLGDLLVFTSYLGMLWDPLCKLTGAGASMQAGVTGAERVFEILDRDSIIEDAPGALDCPRQPRTITLDRLAFSYDGSKPVLRGLDAVIEPGQLVAFVGASGVGKSTLLNLLPRFYDATAGAIRFDDVDIRTIKLRDLRRHMALVLQESVLLPTTIAENIAYGRPTATDAEIRAAAELAGAHAFIEELPGQYQTKIFEGGQNLSGGQRQRIAIARALLTQAPILILDEPTSALDSHHERIITDRLRSIRSDGTKRTVIVVSHRLGTVIHADQIFMMDQGQIVERGTHRELMALRGRYHRMAAGEVADAPILPATATEHVLNAVRTQLAEISRLVNPRRKATVYQ